MRRITMALGTAALAAALLSGCSSDDGDSAGGSPSGGATSSDATSPETVTQVGEAYCDAIEELAGTDEDSDPQEVRDALDQAAENAPEAQAADYQKVAEAYDEYAAQIEDQIGEIPDVPGVDVEAFLESNRDRIDELAQSLIGPTQDLRDQLVAQGGEDCSNGS